MTFDQARANILALFPSISDADIERLEIDHRTASQVTSVTDGLLALNDTDRHSESA
jgi:hypothetical protein